MAGKLTSVGADVKGVTLDAEARGSVQTYE
jgi:hypothetical protein